MTTTLTSALAADVMVRAPKVHGPALTVGECRVALDDDHVHLLLLVEDGRLLGTLARGDVPESAPSSAPALHFSVTSDRTVGPAEPVDPLREAMLAAGVRRLVVVGSQGAVLGLLCLKHHCGGFCSDADVLARAAADAGCA